MADFTPTTLSGRTIRRPEIGNPTRRSNRDAAGSSRLPGDVSPEMRGALTLGGFVGLTAGFVLAPTAAPLMAVAGSAAGATVVGLCRRAGRAGRHTRDFDTTSTRT